MPYPGSKLLLPASLKIFRRGYSRFRASNAPRRILLVKQTERMGNIILMNAGIAGLRKAFPQARIDLMLPAAYTEIMSFNNNIDGVIPIHKREYITRPWALLRLISQIRGHGYDMAINCSDVNSHSSTEASYTILSGAQSTAGWKVGHGGLFDIEVERYSETVHATHMYIRLFSGIFGRPIEGEPFFPQGRSYEETNVPVIGINCGGRGSKRLPIEHLLALGERVARFGARIEFILGPDEVALRADFDRRLPEGCTLRPPAALMELMEIFRGYRAFISSDTGPMHLAWALGLPTVAIFIDSEIEKFRPLSPGSLAVDGTGGIDLDCISHHVLGILNLAKVSK